MNQLIASTDQLTPIARAKRKRGGEADDEDDAWDCLSHGVLSEGVPSEGSSNADVQAMGIPSEGSSKADVQAMGIRLWDILSEGVPPEVSNPDVGCDCPLEPLARARAREIAEVINAGTQPLSNLSLMNAITAATEGADGRAIGKAAMIKGLFAAETLAARNRDCRFCVGAHTSVADLCIVPQLYNARRFGIDLAPYPRLLSVEEHAATLPYFQVAHPSVQPDAVEDAPPKRPNEEEAR